MQTVLSCDNCRRSDFAPFLMLAESEDIDSASQRLWLQCLHCKDLLVMSVDPEVQHQLIELVEDDEEEIPSTDA